MTKTGADNWDDRGRGRWSQHPNPGTRMFSLLHNIRRPAIAVCFLFLLITATPIVTLQAAASMTRSLFPPRSSGILRRLRNGGLQPKRRFVGGTPTGIVARPNTTTDPTGSVTGSSPSSSSVATTAITKEEGERDATVMAAAKPPHSREGFDVLSTLQFLEVDMQRERMMHALASVHFKALYDWFLFLPSILLSLFGGMVAFVSSGNRAAAVAAAATSGPSDGGICSGTANGVGIVSLVSVFWQSLSKQLNFGGRAMVHESAAIAIKRLLEDLPFKRLDPDFTKEETDTYLKQMNEKFHQAVNGCNSAIPIRVSSAFHSLHSELDLHLTLYNNDVFREFGMKREELYLAAGSELFVTFSNFRWWPFILPRSSYAVKTTMKNLFGKFKDAEIRNGDLQLQK